jgi:hypothetical protein
VLIRGQSSDGTGADSNGSGKVLKLRLSCPVLSCPVLSCPVLSCPVLSCPVLSCPAMPCHAMPCHAMPCPALLALLSCSILYSSTPVIIHYIGQLQSFLLIEFFHPCLPSAAFIPTRSRLTFLPLLCHLCNIPLLISPDTMLLNRPL